MDFSPPLHQRVHDTIKSRILQGEWATGAPIPGETDLSRELGVSVGTVRKALDRLTRDHLIFRARGRGTFVHRDINGSVRHLVKFVTPDGSTNKVHRLPSETAKCVAPHDVALALSLPEKQRLTANTVRLQARWVVEGEVVADEITYLSVLRFPNILRRLNGSQIIEQPLQDLLRDTLKVSLGRSTWTFDTWRPPDALSGSTRSALRRCQLNRLTCDNRGKAVAYTQIDVYDPNLRVEVL